MGGSLTFGAIWACQMGAFVVSLKLKPSPMLSTLCNFDKTAHFLKFGNYWGWRGGKMGREGWEGARVGVQKFSQNSLFRAIDN